MTAALQLPPFNPRHAPRATVPATEHRQPRTPQTAALDRVYCSACGKCFVGAAVVTSDVEIVERIGRANVPIRLRQCYCDHCEHVFAWREIVGPDGQLTGTPLEDKPGLLKGRAVEKFLRDHPEAAGVEQS